MKVLYSGTLDVRDGGPALSTYNTARGLNQLGIQTEVLMPPLSLGGRLFGDHVPVHYCQNPIEKTFGFIPEYKKAIRRCGDFDIYECQGIWQYNTYAMIDVAKSLNKPYIITPRGMLYPQDIAKSNTFFKKLSLKLRLLNDLNHAACVHVTCEQEKKYCIDLGVTSPIAVIPNPIEIKDYPYKKKDNIFRLGYLGRISRRKNVESLIYAFASLRKQVTDSELLIIGGGDETYETFLKAEVKRLGLKNVKFLGFLSGEDKDKALASLSVLAMPSEFENLGNVILEGLIRGIPCIATKGSPWQELETEHCGWWVDYSKKAITEAVKLALCCSSEELSIMGMNGRRLMERKYSVMHITSQMKTLYEYILGNVYKPDFVYD